MLKVALAGNPNSGKTTLFNALTGSTAYVGNWPGVTVEKREGKYKKLGDPIQIVDLPGIYSLSPYTPEEVISRNFIIDEKPDCIINIVDATNLERNLYLTTQLLEIDVPVVVALNMIDVVNKSGDVINVKELSEKLGVPVVGISALRDKDFKELMEIVASESEKGRKGTSLLNNNENLSHLIKDVEIAFNAKEVENPLFHSIKLIENDEIEVKMHPDLINIVEEYKKTIKDEVFGDDLEAIIADSRYKYIAANYSPAYKHKEEDVEAVEGEEVKKAKPKLSKSDKIDRVLTNKWAGIPIFLVILLVIFHVTFSANFLYLGGLLDGSSSFEGTVFEGLFWTADGINSPGVILQTLVCNLTDALTEVTASGLESIGCADWAVGLICDGCMSGVFAVLSFIPQILLLFLFFSILEDSGYMARIAFILDRIFRRFGLSGRAFMPMIMGFGCSVPAMINTRTLADDNEKTATVRVIPFFSCGAKLPILVAVSGAIASYMGFANADILTFSMYLLGIVVAICAALLMRHTVMRGKVPPFIMELPAYHAPRFSSLMVHLWDKLKHYVKKAFTIILVSTIAIWFLCHFSFDWRYLADEQIDESIIAGLGQLITPLFTPLGFGSQLSSYGWVFVVAAITGLIAKENVISTFGVLGAVVSSVVAGMPEFASDVEGAADVVLMIQATGINTAGLIAFMAFNLLSIPCFAAVATAKGELTKKKFWGTIGFWLGTSYIVASMIYTVGTWWWTVFIWVVAWAAIITGIVFYNRKHPIQEA